MAEVGTAQSLPPGLQDAGGPSDTDAKTGTATALPSTLDGSTALDRGKKVLSEFWQHLTSESPREILSHGLIPNLTGGLARQFNEATYKQRPAELQLPPAPEGFRYSTSEEYKNTKQALVRLEKPKELGQVLKQAKDFAVEHPGATTAEFLKSIAADPELLLPFVGEAGMATKLSQVLSKAGKAGEVAGRVAGKGIEGGILGAGISGAEQYRTGHGDTAEILSSAAITGALSSFLGLRRGHIPEAELKSGKISDQTAADILDRYAEKTGAEPDITIKDVKRMMFAELHGDADIKAREKAQKLHDTGAPTPKVEKALKDPLVKKHFDEIAQQREQTRGAFEEDANDPVKARAALEKRLNDAKLQGMNAETRAEILKRFDEHQANRLNQEFMVDRQKKLEAMRLQRMDEEQALKTQWEFEDAQRDHQAKVDKAQQIETLWGDRAEQLKTQAADAIKEKRMDELDALEQKLRGEAGRGAKGSKPVGQKGSADPELLAKLAIPGVTAVLAMKMVEQDKIEAAIAGGIAGAALTQLPRYLEFIKHDWKAAMADTTGVGVVTGLGVTLDKDHPVEGAMLGMLYGTTKALPKAVIPKIGNMTIDDIINLRNGSIAARERETSNVSWAIKQAVPDPVRREAISLALEKGDLSGLSESEQAAARAYRKYTDSMGVAAKDAGVIKDMLQNYVTHVIEKIGRPVSDVDKIMDELFAAPTHGGSGSSPKTPFGKERRFDTFQELQKALEGTDSRIKTMDIAEIVKIYGDSMGRALENKKMIDSLKAAKEPTKDGNAYITSFEDAPPGYVTVNNPQMRGYAIHPDLAKPMQFVLEGKTHNDLLAGATALATAQKRLAVGFSFFHAANLGNAYVGATGIGSVFAKKAIDSALKAFREGGAGDTIDTLIRGGLRVERPMEVDQNSLAKIGALADYGVERALGLKTTAGEKALGSVEKVQQQVFDRVTWDYLHTGMKLAVGMREFERLTLKHPELPKEKIATQVASYVNDTFGGLDWYRVATETQSQLGRRIGLAALNPQARVFLQLGMFAPDWTLSTFRAMYKALPGSTDMPLTKELHQKYVMRTAALYMTVMNGINMQTSGHPIWENKDPTRIEFEDGTSMQVAKHAMEGPEWLLHPRQTAMNKLGAIVKVPAELATGRQYLTEKGNAPPIESRTEHLLKSITPIAISSASNTELPTGEKIKRAALGTVGLPMYGMTEEQKAASREARKAEKERKKKLKEAEQ